jgi:hypothetical protein
MLRLKRTHMRHVSNVALNVLTLQCVRRRLIRSTISLAVESRTRETVILTLRMSDWRCGLMLFSHGKLWVKAKVFCLKNTSRAPAPSSFETVHIFSVLTKGSRMTQASLYVKYATRGSPNV